MKLTDKLVAALPIPATGNHRTADTDLPGFCAVVTAAGVRSFALRYRINGRQRLAVIGRFPTWTTTAARHRAKELRRLVDQGIDPLAEAAPFDTVAAVIEQFIARDQKPRNRDWRQVERILKHNLAPWFDRDIRTITRRDVIERLDVICDRGAPIQANRTLAWTRRLFNWALGRDIVEASPVAGVRAPGAETQRDRVLEPTELAAVWRAAEALRTPIGQLIQTLILTAARRGEVATMRWGDLDFERRLWTVPREMTKADRVHEVPLSDLAVEILVSLPHSGELVFPYRGGDTLGGFCRIKEKLDKLSGVAGWRIHDLRRTAASGMARLGHPPHVVAAILNHAPASTMGITAVYNRHRYGDEKRAALDAWSREVERIIGRGEAKVVALRG